MEDKISLYNLFPEIAKEWHPYRNRALSSKDVTAGSNRKVWWKCSECSYEWETTPNKRTGKGNTACPQCKFSKGEKKIASHLLHMKINYKPQYTFNDLTGLGNGLLKFDFAILTENKDELLFLIEYDGEFHYRKFYEEQNYETLLTHDNLKNEYCKNNNIRLLRIPYWDFDNIETLINEFYKNIISTTKQDLMHMS
ncbi:zinc-ribbon domain-containing protein [Niallia circulans]